MFYCAHSIPILARSRRQQVAQIPHPRCDARFHGRRHAQRLVNPAEVVVGEVQTIRRPEILPLLREGIRQTRKSAHAHADRQILALYMRRADLLDRKSVV